MLFLPPTYPSITPNLVASELIKYYAEEQEEHALHERKRAARFARPATCAEDQLALPMSAITHVDEPDDLEVETETASTTSDVSLWDDSSPTQSLAVPSCLWRQFASIESHEP